MTHQVLSPLAFLLSNGYRVWRVAGGLAWLPPEPLTEKEAAEVAAFVKANEREMRRELLWRPKR